MYVPASVTDWQEWTGLMFPESGEYVIEGALTPIRIDLEKDLGEYIEPNVWVTYHL